jgi:hypothetical protein
MPASIATSVTADPTRPRPSPEEVAEQVHRDIHQSDDPDAWRRFWARLVVLTRPEPSCTCHQGDHLAAGPHHLDTCPNYAEWWRELDPPPSDEANTGPAT